MQDLYALDSFSSPADSTFSSIEIAWQPVPAKLSCISSVSSGVSLAAYASTCCMLHPQLSVGLGQLSVGLVSCL